MSLRRPHMRDRGYDAFADLLDVQERHLRYETELARLERRYRYKTLVSTLLSKECLLGFLLGTGVGFLLAVLLG